MPLAADQCFFDGQTVAHGATVTAYQSASVPFGSTCSSQVRTCVSGTLGGSYAFPSCAVTAQNCTPQYSCAGQTVTYLNASCQQSSITTCTAPEFCSEGSAVCRSTPLTGSLSARPSLVRRRDPAYLFWQSAGAESCVVDGTNGDHWDLLNSGPLGFETSPIIQVTHFTLSCTPLSASGSTELIATATVSIAPSWQEI